MSCRAGEGKLVTAFERYALKIVPLSLLSAGTPFPRKLWVILTVFDQA